MYEPNYTDSLRADILPSYNDSLMHHGIKGMHWGVRRFQNSDGSLTNAGKQRYGSKSRRTLFDIFIDKAVKNEIDFDLKRTKKLSEEKKKAIENERAKNELYRKKYDDVEKRAMKVNDEWINLYDNYDCPSRRKYVKAYDKGDYYTDEEKYKKVKKLAYDYGYEAGTHIGKELVSKYGKDAVNRHLDLYLHEDSYYKHVLDFDKLNNKDAVERFAKYMAEYEADHI